MANSIDVGFNVNTEQLEKLAKAFSNIEKNLLKVSLRTWNIQFGRKYDVFSKIETNFPKIQEKLNQKIFKNRFGTTKELFPYEFEYLTEDPKTKLKTNINLLKAHLGVEKQISKETLKRFEIIEKFNKI